MKKYAGIGSRETPTEILHTMQSLAFKLAKDGWCLRSGGARGADTAFEHGANARVIFEAHHATSTAIQLASEFHPAWHKCNEYARKLHGRNSMILLGQNLDDPVKFVVCWTKDGKPSGGTGLGIRIANHYSIPVRNLYFKEVRDSVISYINSERK